MKFLMTIAVALLLSGQIAAQNAKPTIWAIEAKPNMTATVTGSLKTDGYLPANLNWAWNSSIACFPATQKSKFTGNHVLFSVELPPRSILTASVTPDKGGTNLSIYGYQIGGQLVPPDELQSAVTCEADHKWDYPKRGRTQGDERTITFNATTNSYKVVIGVAGADGLTEGDFSLAVTLRQ